MEDDQVGVLLARGYAREVSEASVLRDYSTRDTGGPVLADVVELLRAEGRERPLSGRAGVRVSMAETRAWNIKFGTLHIVYRAVTKESHGNNTCGVRTREYRYRLRKR